MYGVSILQARYRYRYRMAGLERDTSIAIPIAIAITNKPPVVISRFVGVQGPWRAQNDNELGIPNS